MNVLGIKKHFISLIHTLMFTLAMMDPIFTDR